MLAQGKAPRQQKGAEMPSLPAGTYQTASASYIDAGNEIGNTSGMYGTVITAANQVAQAAAWAALLAAMDALALGARKKDNYGDKTTYAVAVPTNGAAREVALQAIFQDATTGSTWRGIVVPTLDISLITYVNNVGAKDAVIMLDGGLVEALYDALVAFPIRNPLAQANTVNIVGMKVVRGQR